MTGSTPSLRGTERSRKSPGFQMYRGCCQDCFRSLRRVGLQLWPHLLARAACRGGVQPVRPMRLSSSSTLYPCAHAPLFLQYPVPMRLSSSSPPPPHPSSPRAPCGSTGGCTSSPRVGAPRAARRVPPPSRFQMWPEWALHSHPPLASSRSKHGRQPRLKRHRQCYWHRTCIRPAGPMPSPCGQVRGLAAMVAGKVVMAAERKAVKGRRDGAGRRY